MLKDHTNFAANFINIGVLIGNILAVYFNSAAAWNFKQI